MLGLQLSEFLSQRSHWPGVHGAVIPTFLKELDEKIRTDSARIPSCTGTEQQTLVGIVVLRNIYREIALELGKSVYFQFMLFLYVLIHCKSVLVIFVLICVFFLKRLQKNSNLNI